MATLVPLPRLAALAAVLTGLTAGCAHKSESSQDRPRTADSPESPGATTVTATDLRQGSEDSIERALMSRVPGVWITRTSDGGIAVRIRGSTSIHGSTQPLFVIDGIAFEPGPGGSLTGINPYDIQSIEVLKDPAETSMYGVRGANGVIVIRTKRPGR
jgi:TonB-dependent SusC/RagA subfamily outer membrane receptor